MGEKFSKFTEVYRSDLLTMLESGEVLPLFDKPIVTLTGNLDGKLNGIVGGSYIEDLDTKTPEGIMGIRLVREGEIDLMSLRLGASMGLNDEVFELEYGDALRDGLIPKQEIEARDPFLKVDEFMKNPKVNYSRHLFTNPATGEYIIVKFCRLSNSFGELLSRSLTITIRDEYLIKELMIEEFPVSFNGDMSLEVEQTYRPVSRELLTEARQFFKENDFDEGNSLIIRYYSNALSGRSQNEEQELSSRFTDPDDLNKLRKILDNLRAKIKAIQESRVFISDNPELKLPSAEELLAYRGLLDQMRH